MTYSVGQTYFGLCMAANAVADIQVQAKEPGDQNDLTKYMKIALCGGDLKAASTTGPFKDWKGPEWVGYFPQQNSALAGGDWEVVWGPSVYIEHPYKELPKPHGGYATNSMFVAHSDELATYVVAIAGTNPKNISDWTEEDFDVSAEKTSLWPPKFPFTVEKHDPIDQTKPQVSGGTALGISNLLMEMKDPKTRQSVSDFLKEKKKPTEKLVFTGHSLGGALSPALAFYLYPDIDSGWAGVEIYPYAGATPGNAAWIKEFAQTYPHVHDHMNIHDVVPHGWNMMDAIISCTGLQKYDSIFGVIHGPVGDEIDGLVEKVKKWPEGVDYANITHDLLGKTDFSDAWGFYSWTDDETYAPYILKTDPQWQKWPPFTKDNPITDTNPENDATLDKSGAQIGNLIYATHIYQYHYIMQVPPVQYLPGIS